MKPIKYELVICRVNGEQLYFNGIKIDTKQDVKRITHSGSYDAIGYVTSDRTVDFNLTDPKDAEMIEKLYYHKNFSMFIFAQNLDTIAWDPIAILEDCVITKVEHNIKAKEEWKPSVSGMAKKFTRRNYQFDPNSDTLLAGAKEGLSKINDVNSKMKANLSEFEKIRNMVGV